MLSSDLLGWVIIKMYRNSSEKLEVEERLRRTKKRKREKENKKKENKIKPGGGLYHPSAWRKSRHTS